MFCAIKFYYCFSFTFGRNASDFNHWMDGPQVPRFSLLIQQIPFPQSTIRALQSRGCHQKNESNPQGDRIHQELFFSTATQDFQ